MGEKVSRQVSVNDPQKRQTLKSACGLAAGSWMASLPSMAKESNQVDVKASTSTFKAPASEPLSPIDMEAVLISIPGKAQASLFLQNLTDNAITLERFHTNKIIFDDEKIDCNDACSTAQITIPGQENELIQFKPQQHDNLGSSIGEFLDVQQHVQRLPEGTRYIRLVVRMTGKGAVLSTVNSGV